MSFETVALYFIAPMLVAALIMSLLLGYGRRVGRGSKVFGWSIALLIVGVPVALLLLSELGGLNVDKAAMPEAAEEAADDGSEPDVDEAKPSKTRALVKKPKRPVTRRVVKKRQADGTITTKTVTIGGEPEVEMSASEDAETEEAEPEAMTMSRPIVEEADRTLNEKFDTVDVFFGTDRNQVTGDKRLEFGANRAGKLTLGKSTITIPKDHDRGIVERPWSISVIGITLYKQSEDPEKHFTVQKIGAMSEGDFVAASNAHLAASETYRNQAAIFVHGYNNDFDTALYRTAQMVYDMGFDGAPYLYSWPSAAGYSTYEYDQQSARQSVEHLTKFIEIVTQKTNAEKIHVVAHSMGNDVLLEALRELRFKFGPDYDYKISQVILAAPDVDRNVFERLARQIAGISEGVTLYASANDKALQFSRTYAGGVARAGDVPEDGPVVVNGVDTIDVSATQQDFWGVNHNTYAEVSELLQDIKRVLLTGVRPPVNRTPDLVPVPAASGTYWRFPPKS